MKYESFKTQALDGRCMSCLNKKYHTNFKPKDCIRTGDTRTCPICGKQRLIVNDIRPLARYQLFFMKENKNAYEQNRSQI